MSRSKRAYAWLAVGLPLICLLIAGTLADPAHADSDADAFSEEEIHFKSDDVTLHGSVLVPDEASPERKPAIVLVHGAGPGPREQYRQEAEAFAREGVVTLIYDKRTEGYSQFERSYELLSKDALAALRALQTHSDVDPEAVGLWGLSEGGWVVPIATSRSGEVAFVVLVAASGVPPARQHSWNLENELRHQGVSGSMLRAIPRTGTHLLVGTGMFAEAYHDPVEPLKGVRQPVLALWGAKDRIEPPAESSRIVRQSLRRGGNTHYTIRVFPNAEHGLRSSPDGFVVRERLAPGYAETVASWVKAVARGREPGPSIVGAPPEQPRPSRPLAPLAWWESDWVQLGAMVLPALAFASYPAVALARSLLRRRNPAPDHRPARRYARLLSGAGLLTVLGFAGYFGFLMFTGAGSVGLVVVGRPLPWLALQMLSAVAAFCAVAVALAWWSARAEMRRVEKARITTLLVGGALFILWAAYWGLLVP